MDGQDLEKRLETVANLATATASIVGEEFIPSQRIGIISNPLLYGPDRVVSINQTRIFDAKDAFSLTPEDTDKLQSHTKDQLHKLGQRISDSVMSEAQLLPELIGANNVLIGHTGNYQEGVWIVDSLAAKRVKLETCMGAVPHQFDIDTYLQRVEMLSSV